MFTYNGKYHYEAAEAGLPATVSLAGNKLVIGLKDEHGNQRNVFWFREKIVVEKMMGADCFLVYEGYPRQTLTISSLDFATELDRWMKQAPAVSSGAKALSALGVILAFIIGIGILLYFWLIPYFAGKAAGSVPVSYEETLGDNAYKALIGQYTVLPDKSKLATEFFQALNIPSKYKVRITVVKNQQLNAFALPGGNIIVYDKLINSMKHPEELAALLSHEFSHVELRHTTKTMFRSMGTYVMISLVFGDLTGVGAVVVENADNLKNLQYSRSLEKEADLHGLELLNERHISGNGFTELFNTLKSDGATAPSEWLSSHPDLDNRIKYIQSHEGYQAGSAIPDSSKLAILFGELQGKSQQW